MCTFMIGMLPASCCYHHPLAQQLVTETSAEFATDGRGRTRWELYSSFPLWNAFFKRNPTKHNKY